MNGLVPWELFQDIPYKGEPPRNLLVQAGWIEDEHDAILKKKDEISSFEQANEWELRKKITNPYEAIFSTSDTKMFPSIALANPLSRSYFKMVEMVHVAGLWAAHGGPSTAGFTSAHVCEGPGGFLQCIVEQAKARRISYKNSYAMTLKSTKSQIPGWKRSSRFLKKHPEIQLLYGNDMTGNILSKDNQDFFCARAGESAIFTADGGFDFSTDYAKQEESSFLLVVASITIGLRCLRLGGVMIVKLFDIYSPVMVDLIVGTAACFDSFLLYKPATSRPCNSERYFIGKGFKRGAGEWIEHLEKAQAKHVERPLTRLCDLPANSPYVQAIKEQIEWQEQLQVDSIERAMFMAKEDIGSYVKDAIEKSVEWCTAFSVPFSVS
jgi:cap2 methyltransferase